MRLFKEFIVTIQEKKKQLFITPIFEYDERGIITLIFDLWNQQR